MTTAASNGRRAGRRRVRVGIVDLIARTATRSPYQRLMNANYVSIMPQAIAAWAEELGCEVQYDTYTGFEDLRRILPREVDILFLSAFTPAAYLAYAISSVYRRRGVVTVLGGPHARAYAQDARRHFDYVAGFTDKALIRELVRHGEPQPRGGVRVTAARQPRDLPGVRRRWRFARHALAKSRVITSVPMLGSLGCPYDCSFCVDATVAYETLPYDQIREDLVFLTRQFARPVVGWHDPNFGIRFDEYMSAIDAAVRPGTVRFVAESSLSVLTESHLKGLAARGFQGLIVGIESWSGFGAKARQRASTGIAKAEAVGRHVDLVTRYIPHVQTNFVWGLDGDAGAEPFDVTRRFLELAPAAFPVHSLFTAFGDSSPLATELAADGRVLDVPYHCQDTSLIHNVRVQHYSAAELYGRLADLAHECYSPGATLRRFRRTPHAWSSGSRWMGMVRAMSSAWRGPHYAKLRDLFATDREFAAFAAGETSAPRAFRASVAAELGPFFYAHLPRDVVTYLEAPWRDRRPSSEAERAVS